MPAYRIYTTIAIAVCLILIIGLIGYFSKSLKCFITNTWNKCSGFLQGFLVIVGITLFFSIIDFDGNIETLIYRFLHGVSFFCGLAFFLALFYFISLIWNKKTKKEIFHSLIWVCIFIFLAVPAELRSRGYGNTQIGSFWENPEYFENYYVEISEDPPTENYQIIYRMPALIRKYTDRHSETYIETITGDEKERVEYETSYILDTIYLPSGEKVTFYVSEDEVIPNKYVEVEDDNNNTYYVRLTTDIVYNQIEPVEMTGAEQIPEYDMALYNDLALYASKFYGGETPDVALQYLLDDLKTQSAE